MNIETGKDAPLILTACDRLQQQVDQLKKALQPLKAIADAFDDNALYEHLNDRDPATIELYSGRGGRQLLTLKHCLDARTLLG